MLFGRCFVWLSGPFFLLYDGIDLHSFYAFHDDDFCKVQASFLECLSALVCVMAPHGEIGCNTWLEYHRCLAASSVHQTGC